MERGVIDVAIQSLVFGADLHYYEVMDYIIDHPYYGAATQGLVVNLDVWNKLPPHLQDLMNEVMVEVEDEMVPWFKDRDNTARKAFLDGGTEFIKFPPDDAEKFMEAADSVLWEIVKDGTDPETYAKLRNMLRRG